jgi:preprotein translocase subunit SecG
MINFLKRLTEFIGMILLGGIVVLGVLLANGFNRYVFLAGVFLIITPIAIGIIIKKLTNSQKRKVKYLKDLKATGIKISVDLTRCNVKSNNWTAEVARHNNSKIVLLNEMSGHPDKNIEKIDSNVSRIEYTCSFKGQSKTFVSPIIEKDSTTLKILLEIQKESAIYIDRDDERYYYFDLEFINK